MRSPTLVIEPVTSSSPDWYFLGVRPKWGPTSRDKVRAAFAAIDSPVAQQTLQRVGDELDAYAGRWTAAWNDACDAGERSSADVRVITLPADGMNAAAPGHRTSARPAGRLSKMLQHCAGGPQGIGPAQVLPKNHR